MLNINNKMYLNKRFAVVDVEFNTMFEIVLAHILAHSYAIADTHIEDIEFDDVLFISDRPVPQHLLLESNDFKEAGVTMQRSNFPKRVKTCSAYEFNEITDRLYNYREGNHLIVIGYVNTIPEHIFTNIITFFGRGVNFAVFGDPIIDAPEHNSYFMRYLTNASIGIRLEYDDYRISDKKKINNTLFKLRKDVSSLTEITASNHVNISGTDVIDIGLISEYLNTDDDTINGVIVPKRLYSKVSSALYQYKNSKSSLDFNIGDIYYTKFNWVFEQDGNTYVIPPMSKILIMQIYNQLFVQKHRCYICDISIQVNGEPFTVRNAVIDFTDYLFNFDQEQHPENMEDYDDMIRDINVFNQHIYDSSVLKVVFAPLMTSETSKYYYPMNKTMSFIETIERDSYYSTDFNWYKHFCNTIEQIDVVISDEFTDIKI